MSPIEPISIESATRDDLIRIVETLLRENAHLRKRVEKLERSNARSATPFSKGKGKPASERKKPGRKGRGQGDKGDFKHRDKPEPKPSCILTTPDGKPTGKSPF